MAQRILIPITDDNSIVSSSPLTYLDTLYYELFYRITGTANYTQQIAESPLELYPLGSPITDTPCIVIPLLANNTEYEYRVRRFNSRNEPSDWDTGTFTTGTS